MTSERSGRPRLPLPCPSTERSTPTGGSGPEIPRSRSRTEPRNGPPREVVSRSSSRRKRIVRNGAPRSRVSWRKALLVRCWRTQYESTTARQVRFSRTRRSCPLLDGQEIPNDRNDHKSRRRPRLSGLAQVPYAHAVRRCLRKAAFRCLSQMCLNGLRPSRHHRNERKPLSPLSSAEAEVAWERSPRFLSPHLERMYTPPSHRFPRRYLPLLRQLTLALTSM